MGWWADMVALEIKRLAKRECRDELAAAIRDVAGSCSDSTTVGDALRRLAAKLDGGASG